MGCPGLLNCCRASLWLQQICFYEVADIMTRTGSPHNNSLDPATKQLGEYLPPNEPSRTSQQNFHGGKSTPKKLILLINGEFWDSYNKTPAPYLDTSLLGANLV
jgi:hypothetical protein